MSPNLPAHFSRRGFLAATGGLAVGAALAGRPPLARAEEITLPAAVRLHPSATDAIITNPERGLHSPQEAHGLTNPWVLRWGGKNNGKFPFVRAEQQDKWEAAREQAVSLIFRSYYLDEMRAVDRLPESFLRIIEDDLNWAREAGFKLILMFAYRNPGDADVARPYDDSPPVERTISHAEQLMPLINDHADVVFALYSGFYGLWGENFYTEAFATSGDPGHPNAIDQANRLRLWHTLFEGAKDVEHIQLRYVGDVDSYVAKYGEPLTARGKLRLGMHNDALASQQGDLGTYLNFSGKGEEVNREAARRRAARTPFGGENPALKEISEAFRAWDEDATSARTELASMHTTYLNGENLTATWGPEALSDLQRSLGYRLEVSEARVPEYLMPGTTFAVEADVRNVGWAAPVSYRPIYLRVDCGPHTWWTPMDREATDLASGTTTTLKASMFLPGDWPRNDTHVSLWLPDAHDRLRDNPAYAIRCASQGWDAAVGTNRLTTLRVW